jgi:phosphoesterase RecJ-like protein
MLLQISTAAQTIEDRPYQITLSVTDGSGSNLGTLDGQIIARPELQTQIEKTIESCRIFAGTRWNVVPQYPDKKPNEKIIPADIDWNKFVERITESSRILITAHVRPDNDCIGSEVAMSRVLRTLGKSVMIVNGQRTPPTLQTTDPENLIRPLEDLTDAEREWIDNIDLLMVLDTRSWQQLGSMGDVIRASRATKIVLDHHNLGDDIGAELYVNKTAEATGRLVFEAVQRLGVPITKQIADPIFTAIATDTGWFRFSSVTPITFRVAAELLDCGVMADEQYRLLYECESLGRIRLIGRALAKTEPMRDGLMMVTSIMQEDLKEAGALPSDTEDIINMTLQVSGSRIAVLFSEQEHDGFKVSFRSRCELDCSILARRFGGGGHKAAAGALIDKSYDETRRMVFEAIDELLKR